MRTLLTIGFIAWFAGGGGNAPCTPAPQAKGKADRQAPDKVWRADDVTGLIGQDGKEVAVRGTIVKVYVPESKALAVLNFGKDSNTCFKAIVYARSFARWEGGLEGIKKYEGRPVTLEGKVSLFEKLPQVVVNVPAQLKEIK